MQSFQTRRLFLFDTHCSANQEARQSEESEAQLLRTVRSQECAIKRDTLAFTEKPGPRAPPDTAAEQHKLAAECCLLDASGEVWLLQKVWAQLRR
jgi:hypothetical protein